MLVTSNGERERERDVERAGGDRGGGKQEGPIMMIPTVFQDPDNRRLSRNVDSRLGGNRICRRLPNIPWEGMTSTGGGRQRLVGT